MTSDLPKRLSVIHYLAKSAKFESFGEGNRLKCLSKSFNNSEMIPQETDKNLKDLWKI